MLLHAPHRPWRAVLSIASLVALTAACGPETPRLAAKGTGDLSNALASRKDPGLELKAACNSSEQPSDSATFPRAPYVQSITEDSARVLFSLRAEQSPDVILSSNDDALRRARAVSVSAVTPPSVRQFEARFRGLRPDTTYCYSVEGMTSPVGFRTAPRGDAHATTRFAVLGDSGTGSFYQRAVSAMLQTVPYQFVLHLGDLAYESGTRSELQSYFFDIYPALTRSFPVYPVAGNHDYRTEAAAPLLEAFSLPDNAPRTRSERFYSFDWGQAHFVGLDTEAMDAEQVTWLDNDLAANDRPWTIVYGHRPLYSSGESGGDAGLRATLGPIFQRYGVQLVLAGHEHDYERTWPIDGVTYVVSGGGGRGTRPVSSSSFTAYSEGVLHLLFIEVESDALVVHAVDGTGREFDDTRIPRLG